MMLAIMAVPFAAIAGLGWLVYLAVKWFKRNNERTKREAETEQLYADARALIAKARTPDDMAGSIIAGIYHGLLDKDERLPHPAILVALHALFSELIAAERFDALPLRPAALDGIPGAQFRDALRDQIARLSPDGAVDSFVSVAASMAREFVSELPPMALCDEASFARECERDDDEGMSVRLLDVVNPGAAVEALVVPLFEPEVREKKLCERLRERLRENQHNLSKVPFTEERRGDPKLIAPLAFKGTADECANAFLRGTPLLPLFSVQLPFSIPERVRCEHQWIIAGSGHGKTQLLQRMMLDDINRNDTPALIVIDSQGDMLRKIARLAIFEHSDRLVFVDPEDERPPALNVFDMSTARLGDYSRLVREEVEAGIIELYNYIFSSIASELTSKQGTAFAYVARLMLAVPGATIHTLRELMEEETRTVHDSRFATAIAALDPTARAFFENQFYNRSFAETRKQIARRLYGVLQVPVFDRMFSSTNSKLDMFAAMQDGKVILINTSRALLKGGASALFGRYMIAQTVRATYERAAIAERDRRPAYLIIDEASEYFDDNIDRLLTQARKFNLGVVLAHQQYKQLSPELVASVASNTSIKMAGGLSSNDAHKLAPDMKTTSEFLLAQQKDGSSPPRWSQFACYVRNQTPHAVSLQVPFGALERAERMSTAAFDYLLERNREQYGIALGSPAPTDTAPGLAPPSPVEPRPAGPRRDSTRPAAVKSRNPATMPEPLQSAALPPEAEESDDWRS